MKIVLDHCVARPFRRFLEAFDVSLAAELGWQRLANGRLLAAAEAAGFDVSVTVDKGFATQQNMSSRSICVVLLDTQDTSMRGLVPLVPLVLVALNNIEHGKLIRVRA